MVHARDAVNGYVTGINTHCRPTGSKSYDVVWTSRPLQIGEKLSEVDHEWADWKTRDKQKLDPELRRRSGRVGWTLDAAPYIRAVMANLNRFASLIAVLSPENQGQAANALAGYIRAKRDDKGSMAERGELAIFGQAIGSSVPEDGLAGLLGSIPAKLAPHAASANDLPSGE
jgi:hypothetical protein